MWHFAFLKIDKVQYVSQCNIRKILTNTCNNKELKFTRLEASEGKTARTPDGYVK